MHREIKGKNKLLSTLYFAVCRLISQLALACPMQSVKWNPDSRVKFRNKLTESYMPEHDSNIFDIVLSLFYNTGMRAPKWTLFHENANNSALAEAFELKFSRFIDLGIAHKLCKFQQIWSWFTDFITTLPTLA